MLKAMTSAERGPKERTPKMDIFSILDMLSNLSRNGSGVDQCVGDHAVCLVFQDSKIAMESHICR